MLNKLLSFVRLHQMLQPGDRVVCAVSGGADSMALLWAMYLLREKLQIQLSAAHFNHGLRGCESDRDQAFVRSFCEGYEIPFFCGTGTVTPGKKGLEAAAREARYGFLKTLPGKIATAHTANDNAETLLMHLVRGTGLKGLGAIAPINGRLIRPMLNVTRQEVLAFLEEYNIAYVADSTNDSDDFLRNRIRHRVIPLLEQENPSIAENLSAAALRLRQDEAALSHMARQEATTDIYSLRQLPPALRNRILSDLLTGWGVREPEAEHVAQLERLVFSGSPSAKVRFSGGITICRVYDHLERIREAGEIPPCPVICPGVTPLPELRLQLICEPVGKNASEGQPVNPVGQMVIRSRRTGDTLRLPGGTKSLKKLLIDRKIPAHVRNQIPVLADELGVLAVYGIGVNRDRQEGAWVCVRFEKYDPAKG